MSSISQLSSWFTSQSSLSESTDQKSPEEKFEELDSDGDGTLDTVELSAMAQEIASTTGVELDVDEAIANYDSDGDGELDQDEVNTMMQESISSSLQSVDSMTWQAIQSYLVNTEESATDSLFSVLKTAAQTQFSLPSSSPPSEDSEEKFDEYDTDGSGGISESELETLAEDFSAVTGVTIDTEEAISTYDADGDGELSSDELDTMMEELQEESGSSSLSEDEEMAQYTAQLNAATTDDERLAILEQMFDAGLFYT